MTIEIPLNARVYCTDGMAGTSEALIFDPTERRATHVVVRERKRPHTKRLVPIDLVTASTEDEIELGCPLSQVRNFDDFIETSFVPDDAPGPFDGIPFASGSALLWPFEYPPAMVPITSEQVPRGELAMDSDSEVDGTDGTVGHLEAFLVGREDKHVSDIVVRSGHVVRREFVVPVSEVAEIDDDRIVLRLDHNAFAGLPHAPYHPVSPPARIDTDLRVVPEPPRAAGLPDVELGASHIEGAHLLSEEAELRLMHRGFTREQVRAWTKEYLAADGSGDVDELVAWIDEKEHEAEMVSPSSAHGARSAGG
jgi:hypothetical protein